MSKGLLCCLCLAVIVITLSACSTSQNVPPVNNSHDSNLSLPVDQWPDLTNLGGMEIIIAEDNAWPPFAYIDKATKKPTGFDYEFFDELCKRANCKPVFKEFAWDGLFEAGLAGEWDITCWGVTMTLERSKRIDYSDPIMEYGEIILTRKDGPAYKTTEEIKNSDALLGATIGSIEAEYSTKLVGEDRVKIFETDDLPVIALLSKDVDALIYDETAAMGVLMEYEDQLVISGRVNTGLFVALPMAPNSKIQVAVNNAINEMWADGTMEKLQKKWFPHLGEFTE